MSNKIYPSLTLSSRPVILCLVPYYLPGYRSGGPVQSIANLVDHLGDEFDIRIVTLDRDFLATESYPKIITNAWNIVGKAKVFYSTPAILPFICYLHALLNAQYDILYLNSFFGFRFTLLPLLMRRLGLVNRKPCVIAPRGQFSSGALLFKSKRKSIYLTLCKLLYIFSELNWQASSIYEEADINRSLGLIPKKVTIAPNLISTKTNRCIPSSIRQPGPLRIVFISRISPKKNLHFLLRSLIDVSGHVLLSVYGHPENSEYLDYCNNFVSRLPSNITVSFYGHIPQDQVSHVFAQHDLFVFPTLGENFGHVIFESLSVGTPVLVSDKTPWASDANGGLQVLELNTSLWSETVEAWVGFSDQKLLDHRIAASEYYKNYCRDDDSVDLSRSMFNDLLAEL